MFRPWLLQVCTYIKKSSSKSHANTYILWCTVDQSNVNVVLEAWLQLLQIQTQILLLWPVWTQLHSALGLEWCANNSVLAGLLLSVQWGLSTALVTVPVTPSQGIIAFVIQIMSPLKQDHAPCIWLLLPKPWTLHCGIWDRIAICQTSNTNMTHFCAWNKLRTKNSHQQDLNFDKLWILC